MKTELGERIRSWYKSYDSCPPWSSFLGFIVRDRKIQREERDEKLTKRVEVMKSNLCQCDNPEEEMNRCKKCRLVIEDKRTANQTVKDIIKLIRE